MSLLDIKIAFPLHKPTAVLSLAKLGVPRPVTLKSPFSISPVRNPEVTHRVPSSARWEALRVAAGVAASRDVVQRRRARRVQERVQEPERRLARSRELVVEQRDHAREDRARAARARDEPGLTADEDLDVVALRGDVRERAPAAVELARVRVAERGEEGRDGARLVARLREEVGEPAGGEAGGGLGDAGGGTDRGHAERTLQFGA